MNHRRAVILFLLAACATAQEPTAALLDPRRITNGEFAAQRFGPARWIDAAHYASLEPDALQTALELVRYDAVSGAREVLVPVTRLACEGRTVPVRIEDYAFSPDGSALLVFADSERVWRQNTRGEYFVLPLAGEGPLRRLGGGLPKSTLMFCKWSPRGDRVAYVSQNDLYVETVATGEQTRLTMDGSATKINGTFDWVYEEEFDCRDGFRWSPDGASIAYWQLDCSGVGEFYLIDNLADRYSRVVPVQYPKAGTTNSACRVGVIPVAGGDTMWMRTPGDSRATYLARMEWHPGGRELMVQWLPRRQNELHVLGCDAGSGAVRVVHMESDPAYVDVRDDFRWVAGGERFFWTSDTAFAKPGETQWRQIGTIAWDTRGKDSTAVAPQALTHGFDVMSVDHADVDRGVVFVSATELAVQKSLYSVPMDGGPAVPVLSGAMPRRYVPFAQPSGKPVGANGWHDYQVAPDGVLAIHTWSSFDVPPVVDLVRLPAHERVRLLVDNQPLRDRYAAVAKGQNDFFTVTTADGIALDGWRMLPPDFDPSRQWPVLFHVYGEPWSQTVKDTWQLGHHLFHRWLTQRGYVVMSVDARGTPAPKGRAWRKALYQKIGITSSHDWDQAVEALCQRWEWMDRRRLAIWGWSGGGAMTLNLLFRHPGRFAAGMSVAPVTDIALYDTIYQERYCGDPREVPEVYRECSPITFAAQLEGQLLLVHGTGDDNVHFQHSERLFDALVAAGKRFEYLAYPNRTHSIHEGKGTRAHLYDSLADFLQRRVPAGPR